MTQTKYILWVAFLIPLVLGIIEGRMMEASVLEYLIPLGVNYVGIAAVLFPVKVGYLNSLDGTPEKKSLRFSWTALIISLVISFTMLWYWISVEIKGFIVVG